MNLPRCIVLATALATAAEPAPAQATGNGQPPQPSGAKVTRDTLRADARSVSLRGLVLRPDGSPAPDARILLTAHTGAPASESRATRTNDRGEYTIDSLAMGTYDLVAEGRDGRTGPVTLTLAGPLRRDILLATDPREDTQTVLHLVATLFCLFVFVVVLVTARWHHIARSMHAMLRGQLAALTVRLDTEVVDCERKKLDALKETVRALSADWTITPPPKVSFMEVLFWSRGRENAAWVVIHELERQLAAFLAPAAQVDAYLIWADAELRGLHRPSAVPIADEIRASRQLPAPATDGERKDREAARKALLGRAISVIYAERDTSFSTLMEWQNKAGWLILAALNIIAFLAVAAGRGTLFLAGAAGGFLSRLMRALNRDDVPLDYGASWTTLFLSPLLGALAGWFGVAIITLAADPRLNLLGEAFRLVQWDHPTGPATLAIAFLLGFSERFFDAVVGALERRVDPANDTRRAHAKPDSGVASGPAAAETADARPRVGARGAPAAAGEATATPAIIGVERQRRAAGATRDALLVKGAAFAAGARVTVNDVERPAELQSAEALLLPLGEADLMRIDTGADFLLVVTNPGGASSSPFDYA